MQLMVDAWLAAPLTRRKTLLALGASAAAGLDRGAPAFARQGDATPEAFPAPAFTLSDDLLQAFEGDVQAAMQTFGLVGSAVALVQDDRVAYARGFGVGDLRRQAPVSEHTRFRIASNTKSLTSLLASTFVDEGLFGWDDRVVDFWPEFAAPTPELTAELRVRDLMGMGSGIAEDPTIEFFMTGGSTSALDLLRSVAYLPVIAPPDTEYSYNNTLVCVAGYLTSLAQDAAPATLEESYARLIRERIFDPIGMADAAIGDDPRPLGADYAVGYTRDLFARLTAVPFGSIDGAAPAGSGIASAEDMARYLITQMNGGLAPDGARVVSEANLAETHRPGIAVLPDALNALPAVVLPDTTAMHYCLGWFDQTFKDGRHLLWHAGGIDGFASLMGFFPEDRIGFVLLTNQEPGRGGSPFNISVQSSLLSRVFGLNQTLPALFARVVPILASQSADLAAQTRPVDPTSVAPYLGLYQQGFQVRLDDAGVLRLDHDIRSMPLAALDGGAYLVANGPSIILEKTVTFAEDSEGNRIMSIAGFDPVRWLTGG